MEAKNPHAKPWLQKTYTVAGYRYDMWQTIENNILMLPPDVRTAIDLSTRCSLVVQVRQYVDMGIAKVEGGFYQIHENGHQASFSHSSTLLYSSDCTLPTFP